MSVFVVRAFIKMRGMLVAQKDLASKLAALEKTLTRRLNLHERVISDIIQELASLLSPPSLPEPAESGSSSTFRKGRRATVKGW
jgi:hypothetical protein